MQRVAGSEPDTAQGVRGLGSDLAESREQRDPLRARLRSDVELLGRLLHRVHPDVDHGRCPAGEGTDRPHLASENGKDLEGSDEGRIRGVRGVGELPLRGTELAEALAPDQLGRVERALGGPEPVEALLRVAPGLHDLDHRHGAPDDHDDEHTDHDPPAATRAARRPARRTLPRRVRRHRWMVRVHPVRLGAPGAGPEGPNRPNGPSSRRGSRSGVPRHHYRRRGWMTTCRGSRRASWPAPRRPARADSRSTSRGSGRTSPPTVSTASSTRSRPTPGSPTPRSVGPGSTTSPGPTTCSPRSGGSTRWRPAGTSRSSVTSPW